MFGFLLAYFVISSGMHAVVAFRLQHLLPQPLPVRLFFSAFLVLMILCPILTHLADRGGHHLLATTLAWAGYTWMGFVFVAFCLGIAFALLELLGAGLRSFGPDWPPLFSPQTRAALLVGLTLAVLAYGAFEARTIRIEQVRLRSAKLDRDIVLAQVSDVHLGLLAGDGRVRAIRSHLEAIQPDMVVCTGDLIDSDPRFLTGLARELRRIKAPLGRFAVTGNHETYSGLNRSRQFLMDAGFTVLDDQVWTGEGLTLAGRSYRHERSCLEEEGLLRDSRPKGFVILLKHSPLVCPESTAHFDLQLSGHTHKGQIFPFGLVVKAVYPFLAGEFPLEDGALLYVSRGTGTWGPQIRFLAPPELTIFTLSPDRG